MILVGDKSSKIYKSVNRFLEFTKKEKYRDVIEFSVDAFYKKTLHPLTYEIEKKEIYIVPCLTESVSDGYDILYSYLALLDNISRNKIKFKKIFVVGMPVNRVDDFSTSYYQAFWNRFKSTTQYEGSELLHCVEIKKCTLDEQKKDPGILFSH